MVGIPSLSLMIVTALPAEPVALRDCVASVPHLGDDTVSLVGYDQEGDIRIEARCHRSDVTMELYTTLLAFVRSCRGAAITPRAELYLYREPQG